MKTVTAAVIRRNDTVLLTRRGPREKLAGYWEFPGGKQDDGESLQECLERELLEELGVVSTAGHVVSETIYQYDHGRFHLIALETVLEKYDFTLSAHDKAEWVNLDDLLKYELAPADIPIAKQLMEERT